MIYEPPTIGNIEPADRARLHAEQEELTGRLTAVLADRYTRRSATAHVKQSGRVLTMDASIMTSERTDQA